MSVDRGLASYAASASIAYSSLTVQAMTSWGAGSETWNRTPAGIIPSSLSV